ncbi:MAG: peptide deformylase [candidate division NC10 bacterium]|nr:peptide deformylase [candidate division NC10 bacterium]
MGKLPVLLYGSPILRQKSLPVQTIDGGLQTFIDDMIETMYAAPGVGLAAPQVGRLSRVIVLNPSEKQDPESLMVLINPEIVQAEGEIMAEEGCLCIPDLREPVTRYERVLVKGYDRNEREVEVEGKGLLARIFQHEVDHLEGLLFVDRLSTAKRDILRKRLKKLLTESR